MKPLFKKMILLSAITAAVTAARVDWRAVRTSVTNTFHRHEWQYWTKREEVKSSWGFAPSVQRTNYRQCTICTQKEVCVVTIKRSKYSGMQIRTEEWIEIPVRPDPVKIERLPGGTDI